ncbi:MAG: non-ribosomal peptide synthetase [Verrucomicrobiales bacterium]
MEKNLNNAAAKSLSTNDQASLFQNDHESHIRKANMTSLENIVNLSPEKKRELLEQLMTEELSQSTNIPLSFAQQRLWFLDKLVPNSAAYVIPTVVRLRGKLNIPAFQKALDQVIARHEALRTTFITRDGDPIQSIQDPLPLDFPLVDLTQVPTNLRQAELHKLIQEEIAKPFDLTKDLMIRAKLVRTDSDEHYLALIIHHIAADEWSMKVLFSEWAMLYQAALTNTLANLPELPIQYADFSMWQREWLQGETLEEQLAYWRQQLKGASVLSLPTDHPRPATQSYKGTITQHLCSNDLKESLKQLAKKEGTTLYTVMLSGFKALLHRYTGQDEIIVGSPIAGRTRVETEGLIGFFVNTLAIKTALQGDPTVRELISRVKESTLGAFEHQDVPFDKLVEELHPERSSTHSPFVQVVFSQENDFVEQHFANIEAEVIEVDSGTAKFELILVAKEKADGLALVAEFNTDLFEKATVEGWLKRLEILLQGMAANRELRLPQLPLLASEERKTILETWNATARDYPRNESIHQLFEAQVAKSPEAIAVVYGERSMTYRDLNARANQLAHRLQKMRVGYQSYVGLFMERSPEMLVGMLGILKAGGAYVPLDSNYPKERLAFMVEDAQLPVIITQESLAEFLPASNATLLRLDTEWESISAESRHVLTTPVTSDDLAYVIYTSGSTGQPKGVAVPHRGVIRLVVNTDYVELGPADRIAQASNASFDAATFEIWGALLNGAKLVGISKDTALSPAEFARELKEQSISTLFLTTALFNQLAHEVPGVFQSVKQLLFGGEAVDPKWVRAVLEYQPPRRLLHVYGPTENTTFSTWHLVKEVAEGAQTIPIGKPIANSSAYILDKNLNPVPAGVPGEVYTGGDGLARGYLHRPEVTAEKFVPNPFGPVGSRLYKTGDLGKFTPNGEIEFVGRIDHQVKIRGFRIELGEIESALARHPNVSNAIVLVREDIPGEKRLVGYLTPKTKPAPATTELREYLNQSLPDYMVPTAFVAMESFPLTPNEKVDRKALPAPDLNRPDLAKNFLAPRDATEQQLARIWEQILGVQPIGIADNFFELGGHSLLAVRLFSQVEKVFGRKLPLATLFRAPTIEQFAQVLKEDHSGENNWHTIVDIQPKGSKPPFYWIHSLGGDGGGGFFYYRKLSELLGESQPSYGVRSPQEPFSKIEDMAAFYVKEIKAFQPEGPYYLGGFCFGGNVAFEIAQQLTAQGDKVGRLILLESSPANIDPKNLKRSSNAFDRFENLMVNVKDFVSQSPEQQVAALKQKGKKLKNRLKSKLGVHDENSGQEIALKDMIDMTNYPKDYVKYAETHWQALTHYQPHQYPGYIHLFRAKKQSVSHFSHTLGWDSLVDDRLSVTVIPGNHDTMLQEPNVQILAAHLQEILAEAYQEQQTTTKSMRELVTA